MLAVCLELREILVEIIPIYFESAELISQSVLDVGWHEPVLEYLDERYLAWRYIFEMPVCRNTHCMSGKTYYHGVWDFLGLSDLVNFVQPEE